MKARKRKGHYEGATVMDVDLRHCVLLRAERVTGYLVLIKMAASCPAHVDREHQAFQY